MSKDTVTLYCKAGEHNWERPSQRGKRPHNCPEHQPEKVEASPKNENGTVTLHCEIGDHDWERPAQRGKRPKNCPDHAPAKPAPSQGLSEEEKSRRRIEGKEKKKRERTEAEKQQMADDLVRLRKALPKADKDYDKALDEAIKATAIDEIKTLFNKTDRAQNVFLHTQRQIRKIEEALHGTN